MTGWVTERGWRYTWDVTGYIDTACHVCKKNQAPVRAKRDFVGGRFICPECGSLLSTLKHGAGEEDE